MIVLQKQWTTLNFLCYINSYSAVYEMGGKIKKIKKALTMSEKKWKYFFKKNIEKELINSFTYYLEIISPQNILKNLSIIPNI